MQAGAFLPLGAFVFVVGWVAWRMLRLGLRTRELPELSLGLGLGLLATVSIPCAAIGRAPATLDLFIGELSFALSMIAATLGISLLFVFTLRVFRWQSKAARAFVAAISLALMFIAIRINTINFIYIGLDEILPRLRPYTLGLVGITVVLFTWSAVESFSYHARLRRRLALGLADPVLVNRFWLWGFASVTTAALVLGILVCIGLGMVIIREPVPLTGIAVAGSLMSVTWYLTFFAPERYKERLRARAAVRYGT